MHCTQCGSGSTSEIGRETPPHKFCHKCHGHEYQGLIVTAKDWERWVNFEGELVGTQNAGDDPRSRVD